MFNFLSSPSQPLEEIDPRLDFTKDTAYVGVKMATATRVVVTSDRRVIPWNETDLLEQGILAAANYPLLLETRWTPESISDFQNGAAAPDTTEVHRQVRSYLQKYLGLRHPAEYDLIACWIMGTYLKPLFKCYPILSFTAPHESGKSRCLEAISQLALNGKWFGEITPAAFRRFTESKLTFCLDELKDIGLKKESAMITILLNAYNGAEVALAESARGGGWLPVIFKVTSPVAMGNLREIKNEALKSRAIQIRTQYDPRYKKAKLPEASAEEPTQIRDWLYSWMLSHWQLIRDSYEAYPPIPELSAREMDSYQPLLAIAALAGPETVQALSGYAVAGREEKILSKKAVDDDLDLLQFLCDELESRGLTGDHPVIANRDLAEAYGEKNKLRVNYKRFLGMVNALHVVADIRNRHGSKYIVFDRAEINRQLQLIEAKA